MFFPKDVQRCALKERNAVIQQSAFKTKDGLKRYMYYECTLRTK